MSQSKTVNETEIDQLDAALVKLAEASPAARFVQTMNSASGRRSAASAIALAGELLLPSVFKTRTGAMRIRGSVDRFTAAAGLKWHLLGKARFGELRAALLARGMAVATMNRVLMSVRGIMRQCWLAHKIDAEQLKRAQEELRTVRGSTIPRGRHLTRDEMARLFRACSCPVGVDVSAARDAALVSLMAVGLRRAEIAMIRVEDLEVRSGRLKVKGKGNKERTVHLTGGAFKAVEHWLLIRNSEPGPMFWSLDHGEIMRGERPITAQAIYKRLQHRSKIAGVKCSPHDLRRTFAGNALSRGVDISTVQQILGHASPSTTARYDLRPDETHRMAMEGDEIPYIEPRSRQ